MPLADGRGLALKIEGARWTRVGAWSGEPMLLLADDGSELRYLAG
jgi:hypothetical protein